MSERIVLFSVYGYLIAVGELLDNLDDIAHDIAHDLPKSGESVAIHRELIDAANKIKGILENEMPTLSRLIEQHIKADG